MGRFMFDSKLFDTWLNSRVEKILPKMEEGNLSNEDMITLLLKAQTNHFHHMDDEFRGEFKSIREEFRGELRSIREEFRGELRSIREEFKELKVSIRWQTGIMITMMAGLYIKICTI